MIPPSEALLGGVLIGLAASGMLLATGRVAGVSGIVNGIFTQIMKKSADITWRLAFVAGLVTGGAALLAFQPEFFAPSEPRRPVGVVIIAGLLVGVGTVMGSGCTSGHGICGISRFSIRSIIATLTFIIFGILSATLFRVLDGGF